MIQHIKKFKLFSSLMGLLLVAAISCEPVLACTRTLYVSADGNVVITGRNMDWKEDMGTNLWAFPAGMKKDGAAGSQSVRWVSKYGSIIAAGYDVGTADGMNEKGLVTSILYLAESDYGARDPQKPVMSIATWAQYVLDNFANVAETVEALKSEPFQIAAPKLPNGAASTMHLAISDASGDSAIFEYIKGKLVIHHGKDYAVMTNSPSYDQQLALNAYWKEIGGLVFLPGTNRAADRFARAAFFLEAIPKALDKNYIAGVPGKTFNNQAIASMLSLQRAVSVPLGITTPGQPNISSTIWRSIADQKNLTYYFDSATSPNTFWVSMDKLDLKPGASVKKLTLQGGAIFAGEVSAHFIETKPFAFLPAGQ